MKKYCTLLLLCAGLALAQTPAPHTTTPTTPVSAPCQVSPFGERELFLRGSMNGWTVQDDFAFQYQCDAYYLNVALSGEKEFKVGDAAWQADSSFGNAPDGHLVAGGQGNLRLHFTGEQTLKFSWVNAKPVLSLGSKSFVDPKARQVIDPVALSLRFDSRASASKQPFGAVVAGTTVDFSVTALAGVRKLTLVIERRRLEGNQEVLEYHELVRIPMVETASGPR